MSKLRLLSAGRAGAVFLALLGIIQNVPASVISFSNATPIDIPGDPFNIGISSGFADPNPSTISVSGVTNVIDVDIILNGLSHTFSRDLEIWITNPGGTSHVVLMDEVGGATLDWTDDTVTFSDGAPAMLDSSPGSDGTFSPSGGICRFPAFCGTAATSLLALAGSDPTGDWNLRIWDDQDGDVGNISNGWTLRFTTETAVVPVPAAIWLFGSGLLGLVGISRNKKYSI